MHPSWRTLGRFPVVASLPRGAARGLLFVYSGRPCVLTWLERQSLYPQIAELVQRCVRSPRLADSPVVGGCARE